MGVEYDEYYLTENLFGNPYPELVDFYSKIERKGRLLDVGCGQGRDAITLARLGYQVTGLDYSKVGIAQLNEIATKEGLSLTGLVRDIYKFVEYDQFDFILLNSMFHFGKKERMKEQDFLKKIVEKSSPGTLITICIQNVGNKMKLLDDTLLMISNSKTVHRKEIIYKYEDPESNHSSTTAYKMITIQKLEGLSTSNID